MAEHGTDAAEVSGGVLVRLEGGRLKNGGGTSKPFFDIAIAGIDDITGSVVRLSEKSSLTAGLPSLALCGPHRGGEPHDIADEVVRADVHRGLVDPGLRIADLVGELLQLIEGSCFLVSGASQFLVCMRFWKVWWTRSTSPVLSLGFLGEVALDIQADVNRMDEIGLQGRLHQLCPWRLPIDAIDDLVPLSRRRIEARAEIRLEVVDHLDLQIVPDVLERTVLEHLFKRGQIARLGEDNRVRCARRQQRSAFC